MIPKRITISGNAGSGKSTIAKSLAKHLNFEYVSIGDFTRKYAKENYNMDINEFQAFCEKNPEIDKEIDIRFAEYCNSNENLVIDYRLGFHFVNDAYDILLLVDEYIAAERIQNAGRTGEKTDVKSIQKRNRDMRNRFLKLYQVDYLNFNNYDFVIDTSRSLASDIQKIILSLVYNINPSKRKECLNSNMNKSVDYFIFDLRINPRPITVNISEYSSLLLLRIKAWFYCRPRR